MALLAELVLALVGLTVIAMVVYDRTRTRRSDTFEEYKDDHMETLTEYRIRRNLHQGG